MALQTGGESTSTKTKPAYSGTPDGLPGIDFDEDQPVNFRDDDDGGEDDRSAKKEKKSSKANPETKESGEDDFGFGGDEDNNKNDDSVDGDEQDTEEDDENEDTDPVAEVLSEEKIEGIGKDDVVSLFKSLDISSKEDLEAFTSYGPVISAYMADNVARKTKELRESGLKLLSVAQRIDEIIEERVDRKLLEMGTIRTPPVPADFPRGANETDAQLKERWKKEYLDRRRAALADPEYAALQKSKIKAANEAKAAAWQKQLEARHTMLNSGIGALEQRLEKAFGGVKDAALKSELTSLYSAVAMGPLVQAAMDGQVINDAFVKRVLLDVHGTLTKASKHIYEATQRSARRTKVRPAATKKVVRNDRRSGYENDGFEES